MIRYLLIFALGVFISCEKNEIESPYYGTLQKASLLCGSLPSRMIWIEELLTASESDPAMSGDLYGIVIRGRTLFVHQPMIMSCLGCLLYDCEGKQIERSMVDADAVIRGMTSENRIFDSF